MVRQRAFVTKPTLVMKVAWAKTHALETQVLSISLQLLVIVTFVGICRGSPEVARVSERVKTMKVILGKGAGT